MTQPYWNPGKVNEIVQQGMPTCDNSRYPIQEFFDSVNSLDPDRGHNYAHRTLGLNRPYFHAPEYYDAPFNKEYISAQGCPEIKEGFLVDSECSGCTVFRFALLAAVIWYFFLRKK